MKTILYVEDNIDTAEAVKIILTRAGFKVDIALTGYDALSKVVQARYDLVLLDVMLPDMSGWDIYMKLKPNYQARFAFISAIPVSHERMTQLKKEGVVDYILKPFLKEDLISRIKKIL